MIYFGFLTDYLCKRAAVDWGYLGIRPQADLQSMGVSPDLLDLRLVGRFSDPHSLDFVQRQKSGEGGRSLALCSVGHLFVAVGFGKQLQCDLPYRKSYKWEAH